MSNYFIWSGHVFLVLAVLCFIAGALRSKREHKQAGRLACNNRYRRMMSGDTSVSVRDKKKDCPTFHE